ncbi:hypothetical protein KCU77_g4622, partial [Aureobasidium melanogenum]
MKLISWLQHHWCLYICWLIQFPAICCLAFMTYLAWGLGQMSPYGTEGKLMLSLCCITILVWIYQVFFYFIHRLTATRMLCMQVFESIFITYLGFYFRGWVFPLHMPPQSWAPIARAVWMGLPMVLVTFYILLARSFVIWYRIRKSKDDSLRGKDGEELENLLHGENYV